MDDPDLDRLLAAARAAPMAPSEALMARILADAEAERPAAARPATPLPAVAAPRRGLWAALAAGLGGSGVLAGLGAAATLGLAVGYLDLAGLGSAAGGFLPLSSTGLELVPATDILLTEG